MTDETECRMDLTLNETERAIEKLVEAFRHDLGNLAEKLSRENNSSRVTASDVYTAAGRIVDIYSDKFPIWMKLVDILFD